MQLYVRFHNVQIVVQLSECVDVPLVLPSHVHLPGLPITLKVGAPSGALDTYRRMRTLNAGA